MVQGSFEEIKIQCYECELWTYWKMYKDDVWIETQWYQSIAAGMNVRTWLCGICSHCGNKVRIEVESVLA